MNRINQNAVVAFKDNFFQFVVIDPDVILKISPASYLTLRQSFSSYPKLLNLPL